MGRPRRATRSRWMKLRDADLLVAHMKHRDFSQARLARAAGCTRQFIYLLATGQKKSCTERVASRIEEALDVPETTLFLPMRSPAKRPTVKTGTTRGRAA